MYHIGTGAGKVMLLDNAAAQTTDTTSWQNTAPTSSVFSIGNDGGTNGNGNTYQAYCFAEKTGFSKFGTYTGNGNANGSFIYTGFRPNMVIVKNYETTDQYQMFDSKRGRNGAMGFVYPDSHEAETATVPMDIYSNGFKFRDASGARNGNGSDFIYMAWAEAPLVGSNNVPCTAR
tara:strand:- start:337 stop:861 length:525 start_codon:yes stop_codon:yes gene_type:complete